MHIRIFALALLALPLAAGESGKKGHPHFDDKGALQWDTTLAAAQARAKKETKLIFIEYGRKL